MIFNHFESVFQKQWVCIVKALRLYSKSNEIARQKHWDYTAKALRLHSNKIEFRKQKDWVDFPIEYTLRKKR